MLWLVSGSCDNMNSWCSLDGVCCCLAWDASGNWAAGLLSDKSLVTMWAWAIAELNTAVAVTAALVCAAALVIWNSDKILTVVALWNGLWALNVLA